MPVAYVIDQGATLALANRRVTVKLDGRDIVAWPLVHLEGLVLFGRIGLTTPLITALLSAGVPLAWLSESGSFRGRLQPPTGGRVDLRQAQHAMSAEAKLCQARIVVRSKIAAQRELLLASLSNHPDAAVADVRRELTRLASMIDRAEERNRLMGVEGAAAAAYWKAMRSVNRSALPFGGRTARPPKDEINAALSFGYALLVNEIWSLLDALGFDPFVGLYHVTTPNRPSLALDVMEPHRHAVIDRLVFRSVNRGELVAGDFERHAGGRTHFTRAGARKFVALYESSVLAWRAAIRVELEALSLALRRDAGVDVLAADPPSTTDAD